MFQIGLPFGGRLLHPVSNEKATHRQTNILCAVSYVWCLPRNALCTILRCSTPAAPCRSEICRNGSVGSGNRNGSCRTIEKVETCGPERSSFQRIDQHAIEPTVLIL